MATQVDWMRLRKHWWSDVTPPAEWQRGIKPISIEGVSLLGVHQETGGLFWDGKEILFRKEVSLGNVEKAAIIAASIATVGLFLIEAAKVLKVVG